MDKTDKKIIAFTDIRTIREIVRTDDSTVRMTDELTFNRATDRATDRATVRMPHIGKIRSVARDTHRASMDEISRIFLNHESTDRTKQITSGIAGKLRGYKSQDTAKSRDPTLNIDFEETIEMLLSCGLTCHYCRMNMALSCTELDTNLEKECSQWSLDRIDNSLPHTADNVVVACLKCNLNRRTMKYEDFKQLRDGFYTNCRKIG